MNHTLGLLGPGPRVRVAWTRVCVPRDGFRFYSKVTPKTTTVAIFTHARGPALKLSRRMSESIGSDVKPPRDRKPLQTHTKKNPRQQTETEKWIQRLTLCVFACECCLCAGVMGSVLLFSVLYFVYVSIFA